MKRQISISRVWKTIDLPVSFGCDSDDMAHSMRFLKLYKPSTAREIGFGENIWPLDRVCCFQDAVLLEAGRNALSLP